MEISVIIPTLNEEENIEKLLVHLKDCLKNVSHEIIVSDAKSSDATPSIVNSVDSVQLLQCEKMSRAHQMNKGAALAKGKILYFVHADSIPPASFYEDILQAFNEGFQLGCYRFKLDSDSLMLAINSYFTRFDRIMCRGGDQTLFIRKTDFEALNGFNDSFRIMEEYDFILRARKQLKFKIIPKDVLVSARKYEENSYLRVNFANLVVFTLFRLGSSQERMIKAYRTLLNHPKAEGLA